MFTGLVETIGTIRELSSTGKSLILGIEPAKRDFAVALGDSVAIAGICLTLEEQSGRILRFRAVEETLSRSTLGALQRGNQVNLERALRPIDRMGGHFVLGHVDGIGILCKDQPCGDSLLRTYQTPAELAPFLAPKGSITIDGTSLTIASSSAETVTLSLIPYSLKHTTLAQQRLGDHSNIECDVLARYMIHAIKYPATPQTLTTAPNNATENLYAQMQRLGF